MPSNPALQCNGALGIFVVSFDIELDHGIEYTYQPTRTDMKTETPEFVLILVEQLGGFGKLKAMINARNFGYSVEHRSLTFQFSGSKVANAVRIVLENDLYDLTFFKNPTMKAMMNGAEPKEVEVLTMVGGEDLIRLFEETTGLKLSLGTMGRERSND